MQYTLQGITLSKDARKKIQTNSCFIATVLVLAWMVKKQLVIFEIYNQIGQLDTSVHLRVTGFKFRGILGGRPLSLLACHEVTSFWPAVGPVLEGGPGGVKPGCRAWRLTASRDGVIMAFNIQPTLGPAPRYQPGQESCPPGFPLGHEAAQSPGWVGSCPTRPRGGGRREAQPHRRS